MLECFLIFSSVGAANPLMGDIGVEALVFMATTTPALMTLDLQSACAWVFVVSKSYRAVGGIG